MRPSRKAQGSKVRGLGSDAPLPHPWPSTGLVSARLPAPTGLIYTVCIIHVGVFTEAAFASEHSHVSMHF